MCEDDDVTGIAFVDTNTNTNTHTHTHTDGIVSQKSGRSIENSRKKIEREEREHRQRIDLTVQYECNKESRFNQR